MLQVHATAEHTPIGEVDALSGVASGQLIFRGLQLKAEIAASLSAPGDAVLRVGANGTVRTLGPRSALPQCIWTFFSQPRVLCGAGACWRGGGL